MFSSIPLLEIPIQPDVIRKYAKYEGISEMFETKAFSLIKEDLLLSYIERVEELFQLYKLNEEHLNQILYIIGQHLFIYQTIEEKRMDASQKSEALLLLRNYHLQNRELDKKYPREEKRVIEELKRSVEFNVSGYQTSYPIKIYDIHFVANAVYQLFKSQSRDDTYEVLKTYDRIPHFEVINQLFIDNQYIIDFRNKYFLAELIIDINEYLQDSISNKYRFIFDILFVSQLFQLNDNTSIEAEIMTGKDRFDTLQIESTYKTSIVKDILKAYKIHIKRNS